MQGGKRRSQHDDEDKKIEQEMLEMEKNLQLGGDVGHSMADFEDWKAKMKELELRKISKTNGTNNSTAIAPRESTTQDTPDDLRPAMPAGSSSITDFLNLKRQEKKEEPQQQTPAKPNRQPIMPKANTEQANDLETNSDLGKSSSSRFSSFFNKSATSLPSLDTNNQAASPGAPVVNNDDNSTPRQSGSRLMSFLKNLDQVLQIQSHNRYLPPIKILERYRLLRSFNSNLNLNLHSKCNQWHFHSILLIIVHSSTGY